VILQRAPDDACVDALVLMAEDVAYSGNVPPAHVLVGGFQLAAEVAAGLGDDFYSAFDRGPQQPGALIVAVGFSLYGVLNPANAFQHVVDAQQGRTRRHLEDPGGLRLDLPADQGMQTVARGEVDFHTKAFLKKTLGGNEVECIEGATRVVVDEEIQVAGGARLVAGGRAEQVERRCAMLPQPLCQGPKFLQGIGAFHGASLSQAYGVRQKRNEERDDREHWRPSSHGFASSGGHAAGDGFAKFGGLE